MNTRCLPQPGRLLHPESAEPRLLCFASSFRAGSPILRASICNRLDQNKQALLRPSAAEAAGTAAIKCDPCAVRRRARMRRGKKPEFTTEAGASSFIYVPSCVLHQKINTSSTDGRERMPVRSGGQAVVFTSTLSRSRRLEAGLGSILFTGLN